MTHKEILEKAITKAIKNGWKAEGLGGTDIWKAMSELERELVCLTT